MTPDERIARAWHEAFRKLSSQYGHRPRTESDRPWSAVPENQRMLMMATVRELVAVGMIEPGNPSLNEPAPVRWLRSVPDEGSA